MYPGASLGEYLSNGFNRCADGPDGIFAGQVVDDLRLAGKYPVKGPAGFSNAGGDAAGAGIAALRGFVGPEVIYQDQFAGRDWQADCFQALPELRFRLQAADIG